MSELTRHRFPLPDDVYQLRVSLIDADPPIWRRLLVDQNVPLPRFHAILQIAMGWTDSHLHQFKVGDLLFAEPHDEYDPGPIDYGRLTLNQILIRPGASCVYEYDFGDSWEHLIELEDRTPRDSVTHRLPRCMDGARACPPEDAGGVHGYKLILAAIADPDHPEHRDYLGWIGGSFDPEVFDLDTVNKRLAAESPTRRRRSS